MIRCVSDCVTFLRGNLTDDFTLNYLGLNTLRVRYFGVGNYYYDALRQRFLGNDRLPEVKWLDDGSCSDIRR